MSQSTSSFFSSGREFELITALLSGSGLSKTGKGPGDDGFLFSSGGTQWAVSSDASVEKIHYRLNWTTPEGALEKAILSNLSDMNAMGARTRFLLLNIGAPPGWQKAVFWRLGEKIRHLEKKFGFSVSGGDLTRSDRGSFFSITVIGEISGKPLLRSHARPGDTIYHSGELGSSKAGLKLLTRHSREHHGKMNVESCKKREDTEYFTSRHHLPEVPVKLGPVLSRLEKRVCAIDISDGLSSELQHISRMSGCRMEINMEKLNYHRTMDGLLGKAAVTDCLLHGGEDYQLLFTGNFSGPELKKIQTTANVTEIGRVERGKGVFLRQAGKPRELKPQGWIH